ncbi:GH25 family lysozyme [Lacticaseibacillus absianus]|uniref:GH25 family lysozyme n=1 Tax=Lacticaseibacillus absianus TaxID=2729623 RepID=UPI0015C8F47D|nr:GH25 family lysozyme [Lacticaseibacillus absianus]
MTLNGYDLSSNNVLAKRAFSVGPVASDFVVIKATEGLTYVNPLMTVHLTQALAAGRLVGLYHYLRANAPEAEAAHFLQIVRPYLGQAVLALDIEDRPLLSQLGPDNGLRFLDAVWQVSGVRPLVYTNVSEERSRDWRRVVARGYPLWIAQYDHTRPVDGYQPRRLAAVLRHWPTYAMYQYTPSGRLPGWAGPLDLNVFTKDAAAWRALARGTQLPLMVAEPIAGLQRWLNATGAAQLAVDGQAGPLTRTALVSAVQRELNRQFNAGLTVDGRFGPASQAAMRPVQRGASGPLTRLIQGALVIRGVGPLALDGQFGLATEAAVRRFQSAQRLVSDGVVGPQTARWLFEW